MDAPPGRGSDSDGDGEAGPEDALSKSPAQLTAEDVYDISLVVGRELMALGSDPRVTRLQFKIVRVLELLEALVRAGSLAAAELRLERDSLAQELERLRRAGPGAGSLGPDKMVVDLADPDRPRFTLQELREVLQERNRLKCRLLAVQEELQCYKSGLISSREDPEGREKATLVARTSSAGGNKEKTTIRKLFFSRLGKQT